jgi:hypothetical protein
MKQADGGVVGYYAGNERIYIRSMGCALVLVQNPTYRWMTYGEYFNGVANISSFFFTTPDCTGSPYWPSPAFFLDCLVTRLSDGTVAYLAPEQPITTVQNVAVYSFGGGATGIYSCSSVNQTLNVAMKMKVAAVEPLPLPTQPLTIEAP